MRGHRRCVFALGPLAAAALWVGLQFFGGGTALAAVLLRESVGPAFVIGSGIIGVSVWLVSRDRADSSSGHQRPNHNGSDL